MGWNCPPCLVTSGASGMTPLVIVLLTGRRLGEEPGKGRENKGPEFMAWEPKE